MGTWITSVRRHLRKALLEGLIHESMHLKPLSFISHPFPECSCSRQGHTDMSFHVSSPSSTHLRVQVAQGVAHPCPTWMDGGTISQSIDKAREEDLDEDDDSSSAGLFFGHSGGSHGGRGGEINNKEEALMEDQEELEGVER